MQVLFHVAQKLQQIHAAGFAHRDVKPSNVILDSRSKQWMLIDFASAAPIGQVKSIAFSLQFAPPETAQRIMEKKRSAVVSGTCDVWALGIMAWTLLTGKSPYAKGSDIMPKLLGTQNFPWEDPLDVQTRFRLGILAPTVRSMLLRDPEQRVTIDALLASWQALFHDTSSEEPAHVNSVKHESIPVSNSTDSLGYLAASSGLTTSTIFQFPQPPWCQAPNIKERSTSGDKTLARCGLPTSETSADKAEGCTMSTTGLQTREDAIHIINMCVGMQASISQAMSLGIEASISDRGETNDSGPTFDGVSRRASELESAVDRGSTGTFQSCETQSPLKSSSSV